MNQPARYCPARTLRFRSLLSGRGTLPCLKSLGWPQLQGDCILPFSHGRAALWFLCHHWKLDPGDQVLMPAYNCGSEIDPFQVYGARVSFYRIDKRAQIDIGDIKARCGPRTRVVYVTHYFGWPQPTGDLFEWCTENNIKIIEDCALSLFSGIGDEPPGSRADATLFSFKKFLSVPDGAALIVKDAADAGLPTLHPPAPGNLFGELLPFARSSALGLLDALGLFAPYQRACGFLARNSREADESQENCEFELPPCDYFDKRLADRHFSGYTSDILWRTNPDQVIAQRRNNYIALRAILGNTTQVQLLFNDLPDTVCPMGLPILFSRRMALVRTLNARGIGAIPWWSGFHKDFSWKFHPEAQFLKQNVVLLPVNQDLNMPHIRHVADAVQHALAGLSS